MINQVQATFFPFTWQPPRPAITYNIIAGGGQRRPYPTGNTYRLRTIPPPLPPQVFRGSQPPIPPYSIRFGGGIPARSISNPFEGQVFRESQPPIPPYDLRLNGIPPQQNPYNIGLPYTIPRQNSLDQFYGPLSYDNEPYGQSIPNYYFRSPYPFQQTQQPPSPFEHEENPFIRSPHQETRHPHSLHPGFPVRSNPIVPPSIFMRPPINPPPGAGF